MLQFLTFDLMNLLQDGPIRLRRVWPLLLGLMCWLDLSPHLRAQAPIESNTTPTWGEAIDAYACF